MRRRCDPHVIPDPSCQYGGHSTSERQVVPPTRILDTEVPELWLKHARQPWKVIFPDLDWPLPEWDA